jgi:hypothetical protein
MAVTVTTIQPQDSLASSRITLNSNFASLKAGIDSVQVLLDPSTFILQGVKSATINDSAVPFSTSVFQVGKGSSLLGNVIMGTVGASTSVLVNGTGGVTFAQASLTVTSGNVTLSGSSSVASLGGHLKVTNELRLPGVANAFSTLVGLTANASVNVANLKYLVVKNSSNTSGLTASLTAGTPGQVLEIFHVLGASGFPVYVNTSNFYGLTGSITMKKTGDTLKCVFDGTSWYLWNYSSASFATGGTTSSVTFTTTI